MFTTAANFHFSVVTCGALCLSDMHLLYSFPVYMCIVLLCQDAMKWHEFCSTFPGMVPPLCYKFCTSKPFFSTSCTVFVVNPDVLIMSVHTVGVHHNTDLAVLVLASLYNTHASAYQVGTINIAGIYERCTCDRS